MIKYNSNTINDWDYDAANIIKVYRNGAVVFYKVSGESPTPVQEPCFAVVDDISQYSDTEFIDAFNKADGKWYKLNNLNQYEQYGIYDVGSSLSDFTYYEGKLVATGTTEYQRSGGTWVEVGTYEDVSVTYTIDDSDPYAYYGQTLSTTFKIPVADVEALGGWLNLGIKTSDGELRIYVDGYVYYVVDDYEEGTVTNDGTYYNYSLPDTQSVVIEYINYWYPYQIHIIAGSKQVSVEYDEIQDPPDNLVFSSMSDALEYECPWWGMSAKIGNEYYVFCDDDSWLTKYSYVEVSGYICENSNKYKKMQVYARNADKTFSPTQDYVKGDLIEAESSDCICSYNFCGVAANGTIVTINNGTTTLSNSGWRTPYPVEGMVGSSTNTIGAYCFQTIKTTLSALTIATTVTKIEHEAFMETNKLRRLTIPSSVTQIDFWAFTRCNGLQEVIFEGTTPPTFTNQHSGVFHDYCPPVIYVPDSALSAYRAISASVWTNQSFDVNTRIKGISERS